MSTAPVMDDCPKCVHIQHTLALSRRGGGRRRYRISTGMVDRRYWVGGKNGHSSCIIDICDSCGCSARVALPSPEEERARKAAITRRQKHEAGLRESPWDILNKE